MSLATLTSKGQITLPKDIRIKLHLHAGEKVECRVDEKSGAAILVPLNKKVDDAYGMLHGYAPKKAIAVEEMDEVLAKRFKKGLQ